MTLVFSFWLFNLLAITLPIWIGIFFYYKHAFQYWKNRNLSCGIQPVFPFGNIPTPLLHKLHIGEFMKNQFTVYRSQGFKHCGGYLITTPIYNPCHPDYIKNILQKDFHHFTERGFYYNEKDDPLSANLFALGGEKWQILRTKLSPAFTSGKLKIMFGEILQCAEQMQEAIKKHCDNHQAVNINEISECFTVDVIGSCAFGLNCDSFQNPEAEFKKQGKRIFSFTALRVMKTVFAFGFPNMARRLGVRLFDEETTEFFTSVVKESLAYRKNNDIARNDFLRLLLELGNNTETNSVEKAKSKPRFTISELTAQVFIFFAAAFETSSLTIAYCLYELAVNLDIQTKVRKEINQLLANNQGQISYDTILNIKYLNQVVEETLRKYPPVPFITRVCIKDYQVPETDVVIEKGITVLISIMGVHHDSEFYPNPDKFDPERFSEENKRNRHPFVYMPFGEGPRICIGLRFGLMQTKIGLISLLRRYQFSLNRKTKTPLLFDPYTFTLIPKSKILLDVEEIAT